jgi:16S rRNA (guanine(966)-N(2))-methyltransferase RsmD
MRIIAGKFRSRRLKSPPSLLTRPTSDRLRETLFNILSPQITGSNFLDLCAGSGAVGIEALSRGAARVTFVDKSRKMCALIKANTELLQLGEEEFEIVNANALVFLKKRIEETKAPFDLVYFDPPYGDDYEKTLHELAGHRAHLLSADAIVIAEHHKKTDLSGKFGELRRYRTLQQGESCLSFYR